MSMKKVKELYQIVLQENRTRYQHEFEKQINDLYPYEYHNYVNGIYYELRLENIPVGWNLVNFYYDGTYYNHYIKSKLNTNERLQFLLDELDISFRQSSRYVSFD